MIGVKKFHNKEGFMDLFTVRLITEAADCGSLSAVAQKYSYTPSALSHMLAGFEKELGIRMFVRSTSGVSLSEEGKEIYPRLTALLESEAELFKKAEALKKEASGQLRIAAYSSISRNLLTDLLKRFMKEYPGIGIAVNVVDKPAGWLDRDKADIVFADRAACGENEWFPMMEDEYLAVVPENITMEGETVSRNELYGYPYIDTDESILKNYFDMSEFKERIYFHSEDDLSVIRMVQAGIGVTVLPELVLKETAEKIKFLHLDPPCVRSLGFAYRKDRKNSRILKLFADFVRNV